MLRGAPILMTKTPIQPVHVSSLIFHPGAKPLSAASISQYNHVIQYDVTVDYMQNTVKVLNASSNAPHSTQNVNRQKKPTHSPSASLPPRPTLPTHSH